MTRWIPALAACACAFVSHQAFACGGLFCNSTPNNPPVVVQTGEKILFAYQSGEVTAHVQIHYQGAPSAFGWVVPVPAQPTLAVGSDQVFSILDRATSPQFNVQWTSRCARPSPPPFSCAGESLSDVPVGQEGDAGSSVAIISEQPIGPFDTAILSSSDAQALQTWLSNNGFNIPASAQPLLAPYVAQNDYFVALKLQPGRTDADLQPIVLKFPSTEGPCVPIRLTAIASAPNLGILVFLLGNSPGVSTNYPNLVLNEAKLDWTEGAPNYAAAVAAAVTEAGGHGFVTDYAGSPATAQSQIQSAFARYSRSNVSSTEPLQFVHGVTGAGLLGASQNVLGILTQCVPEPASEVSAGVTPLQFYGNIDSFSADLAGTSVNQPTCGDEVDQWVIQPLRDADALMTSGGTLTRLFTTLSPDQMTLDPTFAFNASAPAVAAQRSLTGVQECNGSSPTSATLTSSDGAPFNIPWHSTLSTGPALLRVEHYGATGAPVVSTDNTVTVHQSWRRTVSGCGCTVALNVSVVGIALSLLALRARRARRF